MLSAICRRQFIRTVENIRLLRCFSAEAHSSEGSSEGKSEGRWSNWTGPPEKDENDNDSIKDPVSDKLLPDPVKPPYYQPPYTLVIEMTDVLVHPEWKFRSGWRFKKRSALELFLSQLSPYYEVVVYTGEALMTAGPVLAQLDPDGRYIHCRLFRESTRYKGGTHFKDLSCLNRDLSRVIYVDWNPKVANLQPRNSFIIKRWTGDDDDHELVDLTAFLRMLAMGQVSDVRDVLDHYRDSDDSLAMFREKQEELIEIQTKRKEENLKTLSKKRTPTFSFSGMLKP